MTITLELAGQRLQIEPTGSVDIGWGATVTLSTQFGILNCETELVEIPKFVKEVQALHATLGGEATLSSLEGKFRLRVSSDDRGRVSLGAEQFDFVGGPTEFSCKASFAIDQSYLPSLISELEKSFGLVTQ